ncbi:MAG: TetR/AcrR family transcriptional regulator [Chloroflexota bacterium]
MDESFDVERLRAILKKHFNLAWKYRFFFREYAALLHNDAQLSKRFGEVQEQRLSQQEALIRLLAAGRGGGAAPDPKEIRNVALIGWVLGNTWLSYVESTGRKIDSAAFDGAVEIMILPYKPYLPE